MRDNGAGRRVARTPRPDLRRIEGPQRTGRLAHRRTQLSCRRSRDNQVRLQLLALAYTRPTSCGDWRRPAGADLGADDAVGEADPDRAKVASQAKTATLQLAEVAVLRALFAAILGQIAQLRAAPSTG